MKQEGYKLKANQVYIAMSYLRKKKNKGEGCSSLLRCLPSTYRVLSWVSRTEKKKNSPSTFPIWCSNLCTQGTCLLPACASHNSFCTQHHYSLSLINTNKEPFYGQKWQHVMSLVLTAWPQTASHINSRKRNGPLKNIIQKGPCQPGRNEEVAVFRCQGGRSLLALALCSPRME